MGAPKKLVEHLLRVVLGLARRAQHGNGLHVRADGQDLVPQTWTPDQPAQKTAAQTETNKCLSNETKPNK